MGVDQRGYGHSDIRFTVHFDPDYCWAISEFCEPEGRRASITPPFWFVRFDTRCSQFYVPVPDGTGATSSGYSIGQRLGSLEFDRGFGRDLNLFARHRVPAHPGFPVSQAERAKVVQTHIIAVFQAVTDTGDQGIGNGDDLSLGGTSVVVFFNLIHDLSQGFQ